MFLFGRKTTVSQCGLLEGFTDFHCHILPGVDDGVRTLEDSLAILEDYEKAGVRSVWLTPHIMEDMPNTTAALRQAFEELRAAYRGGVELHLGAENMLDNLFNERFMAKDLLPVAGKNLLVETSYFNPPLEMEAKLSAIASAGYYPLLAHPERYIYMTKSDYSKLKDRGVRFQLNIPSLGGFYGEDVKARAEMILKNGWYDFYGTDLHRHEAFTRMQAIQLHKDKVAALKELKSKNK